MPYTLNPTLASPQLSPRLTVRCHPRTSVRSVVHWEQTARGETSRGVFTRKTSSEGDNDDDESIVFTIDEALLDQAVEVLKVVAMVAAAYFVYRATS